MAVRATQGTRRARVPHPCTRQGCLSAARLACPRVSTVWQAALQVRPAQLRSSVPGLQTQCCPAAWPDPAPHNKPTKKRLPCAQRAMPGAQAHCLCLHRAGRSKAHHAQVRLKIKLAPADPKRKRRAPFHSPSHWPGPGRALLSMRLSAAPAARRWLATTSYPLHRRTPPQPTHRASTRGPR